MKKLGFMTVALMVAGFAFASSLSVPWFVDAPMTGAGFPPTKQGTEAVVYLHNNLGTALTCSIDYYTNTGFKLPFADGVANTFTIRPRATIAFRPNAKDPSSVNGGQEADDAGMLVPDRPSVSSISGGTKANGSIVVSWVGSSSDVQGIILQAQNVDGGSNSRLVEYGTLLPSGV